MTYATQEESIEDGQPFHLYRFTLGDTIWRYTTADQNQTIDGQEWRAVAIEDSGVSQTGEISADALSITASWTIGPAQVYMSTPPSEPIIVERLGMHEGIAVPVVNYVGEILQVNFPTPGQVVISAHTLSATMRRAGLRLGWQRTCPYALYDPTTCKVNPADFSVVAKVEAVDGFQITLSNLQAGANYQGGYYEWEHPTRGTQRTAIGSYSDTGVAPPTTIVSYSYVTPGSYSIAVPVGTTSYSWSISGGGGGGSSGGRGTFYTNEGGQLVPFTSGADGFPGARGSLVNGTKLSPTVGATLNIVIGSGGAGGAVDATEGMPSQAGANGVASTMTGDSLSISAAGGGGASPTSAGSGSGTGAAAGARGLGENRLLASGVLNEATPGGDGGDGYLTLTFATSNDALNVGTINAFGDTSEIHPGMFITVYPGCQRTTAACETFNNRDNYGGFEWMPGKSPFDGTPFF
jgi:hypothetical protein